MHPYAKSAALAAEAASLQGKFWEMHDAIFENQNALNDEWLLDMAQKLDLDMDKFRSALKDESLLDRVEGDFESGMMSGVNGTPTFFVNGQKFDGGAEDLVHVLGES